MLLAFAVVILTPARPLWPVRTVFAKLGNTGANNSLIKRIKGVYLVYADRPDPLACVREVLPENCDVVGFVGESDDTEISLWRPFGQRRVEQILPDDTAAQIRARHLQYAVVGEVYLTNHQQTIQAWLQQHQASLVQTFTVTLTVAAGPRQWHVVRFE
jgi:hypothetical protein